MLQKPKHPNSTAILRAKPPHTPTLHGIANPPRSTLLITSSHVLARMSLCEQRSYKKMLFLHSIRFKLRISFPSANPTRTEFQSQVDLGPPISTHVTTRKALERVQEIDAGSSMRDLFKYPLSLPPRDGAPALLESRLQFLVFARSFLSGRALISDEFLSLCDLYPEED